MKRQGTVESVLDAKKASLSIRERYRYFKQKQQQPDYSSISNSLVRSVNADVPVTEKSDIFKADKEIWQLNSGLILARGLLSESFIDEVTDLCINHFPKRLDAKTNVTNLGKNINSMVDDFSSDTILAKSDLMALRWTTLGHHHNWDTRQYSTTATDVGLVPDILKKVATEISKVFKLQSSLQAEASICNFYPANVGTIGIHRDNSGNKIVIL